MKLKQSFVVQHPRAVVWGYFGRIADVSQCMPGVSVTVPESGAPVDFTLAVKLGPISTAFAGSCEVERDDKVFRGVIRGSGQDRRSNSRTKGEIEYRLAEEQDGRTTRVDIAHDGENGLFLAETHPTFDCRVCHQPAGASGRDIFVQPSGANNSKAVECWLNHLAGDMGTYQSIFWRPVAAPLISTAEIGLLHMGIVQQLLTRAVQCHAAGFQQIRAIA